MSATTVPAHPGHVITVTPGPFGRAFFECSCGESQLRASKSQAVRIALAHHHDVGGCNCPDLVKALLEHVTCRSAEPETEPRYWLTEKGYGALAQSDPTTQEN